MCSDQCARQPQASGTSCRRDLCRPLRWVIACAALCGHSAAGDDSLDVGFGVTLTSDYVYRGVSQTLGKPAIQASVAVEHPNGLFGWLWASNVDYVKDRDPDDGANREIDLVLGYSFALDERAEVSLSVLRFAVPGTNEVDYDFTEWTTELLLADRHRLRASYSASAWGTGRPSWYYAASTSWPLGRDLSVAVEAGYFDLERALGDAYGYGAVSLALDRDWFAWTLAHYAVTDSASDLFYDSVVGARTVISLDLFF